EGTQPATEPTATPAPAATAGPTPIAGLTVPGVLPPFEDLEITSLGHQRHGDNLETNAIALLPAKTDATPTAGRSAFRENLWNLMMDGTRLKILAYSPEVDPLDQEDASFDTNNERVLEVVLTSTGQEFENTLTGLPASVYFDLDDERLIVVEELAFCRDGRGIYLEQSANPEAIGETFGWEVYIDRSDTIGMFHIVLIAAPDSPITHDGSDPKRLDITWEPTHNVITADVGGAMVGIFADGGQQVREMCAG
ncbi:MAG: hypothetical protein V3T49_05725, partial [Dehalococcoidia bacterium]